MPVTPPLRGIQIQEDCWNYLASSTHEKRGLQVWEESQRNKWIVTDGNSAPSSGICLCIISYICAHMYTHTYKSTAKLFKICMK